MIVYAKARKGGKFHLSFRFDNGRTINKIMGLDDAIKAASTADLLGPAASQIKQHMTTMKGE